MKEVKIFVDEGRIFAKDNEGVEYDLECEDQYGNSQLVFPVQIIENKDLT